MAKNAKTVKSVLSLCLSVREKDKCNLVLLRVKLGLSFVCYCCLISFLKLQEYQNCCLESKAVAFTRS